MKVEAGWQCRSQSTEGHHAGETRHTPNFCWRLRIGTGSPPATRHAWPESRLWSLVLGKPTQNRWRAFPAASPRLHHRLHGGSRRITFRLAGRSLPFGKCHPDEAPNNTASPISSVRPPAVGLPVRWDGKAVRDCPRSILTACVPGG